MRTVVVFEFLSLDGVAEAPDRFFTAWDDVVDASGDALIATQDAVVLGRRTHDEWAAYWPGGDIGVHASISLARALLSGGVVDHRVLGDL